MPSPITWVNIELDTVLALESRLLRNANPGMESDCEHRTKNIQQRIDESYVRTMPEDG
jgi:hypothetical protein